MELNREGISNVRVFMPISGAGFDKRWVQDGSSLVVRWHSVHDDKPHAVFVNGSLEAISSEPLQRQVSVGWGAGFDEPVRVSVYAVTSFESAVSTETETADKVSSGKAELLWAKVMGLGIDSKVEVFSDNGSGEIDYSGRVNYRDIYAYDSWQDKCGFGMSMFGRGDFGYDSQAAAGFGAGVFGLGDFGFGAYASRWVSEPLADADYLFGLRTVDGAGVYALAGTDDQVRIIGADFNRGELAVSGFDESGQLVFNY